MEETVQFRMMTVDDIEQVYNVEINSFTLPWSKEAFLNEMTTNQHAKYIVMELGNQLIGYCGMWIILDESHITNIAVLPEYRGKKYGDALMKQVFEFNRSLGVRSITLEVRITNEVAQGLYKKYGFKTGGVRKNYYADNHEDALVMWVNI